MCLTFVLHILWVLPWGGRGGFCRYSNSPAKEITEEVRQRMHEMCERPYLWGKELQENSQGLTSRFPPENKASTM